MDKSLDVVPILNVQKTIFLSLQDSNEHYNQPSETRSFSSNAKFKKNQREEQVFNSFYDTIKLLILLSDKNIMRKDHSRQISNNILI